MLQNTDNNPRSQLLVQVLAPALIMLMVGSLVFFLIEVFYRGPHAGRLRWVLGLFTFASVLVSRVSIQEGLERASVFGTALAVATFITSMQLVQFADVSFAIAQPFVTAGLICVVMWSASRLTWDCTVIDQSRDVSAIGLTELVKRKWAAGTSRADPQHSLDTDVLPDSEAPESQNSGNLADALISRLQFKNPHSKNTPGLWVFYFSAAAFPIFGFGQWFVPQHPTAGQGWIFLLFAVYLGAALGLLMLSSLLSLQRYLRKRGATMPPIIQRNWLIVGTVFALAVMAVVVIVPRPNLSSSADNALAFFASRNRAPSKLAVGRDGLQARDHGNSQVKSETKGKQTSGSEKQGSGKQNSGKNNQGSSGKSSKNLKNKQSGKSAGQDKSERSTRNRERRTDQTQKSESSMNSAGSKSRNSDQAGSKSRQSPSNQDRQSKQADNASHQDRDNRTDRTDSDKSNKKPGRQSSQKQSNESKDHSNRHPDDQSQDGAESRQDESAGDKNDEDNAQENNAQEKGSSRGSSRNSTGHPPPSALPRLSNATQQLAFLVKGIFYLVGGAALLLLIWMFRDELRKLWQSLFGKQKQTDAAIGENETPQPQKRPPSLADFRNPFTSGAVDRWDPQRTIHYTFAALEAWARRHGYCRDPDETAYELASALKQLDSTIFTEAQTLAELHSRSFFSSQKVTRAELNPLVALWQRFDAVATSH